MLCTEGCVKGFFLFKRRCGKANYTQYTSYLQNVWEIWGPEIYRSSKLCFFAAGQRFVWQSYRCDQSLPYKLQLQEIASSINSDSAEKKSILEVWLKKTKKNINTERDDQKEIVQKLTTKSYGSICYKYNISVPNCPN